jgi:arylsulfatase A-like enzyme
LLRSFHIAVVSRGTMRGLFLAILAILVVLCTSLYAETQPNILVILADDLGYADLGCQGSPDVKTPNIDSIAANGVRCTAGYVTAPQCSPSRAGLMSGQYQQRFGHEGNPNFPLMLMGGGKTIADHLKAAGYATGHFGKWHLGFSDMGSAPKEIRESKDQMTPTQHGFDESFGYPEYEKVAEKGSDITPAKHAHDDRVFARKAADFIQRHHEQPVFIYLAFHAPHTQQVDFGSYRAQFPGIPKERLNVLSVMAQQDEAVGTVLANLRELKQDTNTLIFYLSDNGGTRRSEGETKHFTGSLNTPFSGDKGTALEGGIRVPFIVQWPGHLPAGKTYDRPVSTLDVLPTALAAGKVAITAPRDEPGASETNAAVNSTKTSPAVDVPRSSRRSEMATVPDGMNLLPFLTGENTADPHEALFWRWRAEQAIRMGDWKLVRGRAEKQWRLIDLSHDVKEEHDLTPQHPDKATELRARFEKWASELPPVGPSLKDTTEGDEDESKAKKQ